MSYFITEAERGLIGSTAFVEIQKGNFHDEFWMDDSIYISAEDFDDLKLSRIIRKAIPDFDKYGVTVLNGEDWELLYEVLYGESEELRELADELAVWAEDCFSDNDSFSILGL